MVFCKGLIKAFIFALYNMGYMIQGSFLLFTIKDPIKRKRALINNISRWTGRALRLLGFKVVVEGKENLPHDDKALIISNHMTYLDVYILAACYPSVFVTSVEVRDAFFLGFLCKLGATLFIERRSRHGLQKEIKNISDTINEGLPVILFPEGTSSNGDDVLPFKTSFMALAKKADVDLFPVCLKYQTINNSEITPQNRDKIYYYGDVEFFPQFVRLPFLEEVSVRVSFLPKISSKEYDRKELTAKAREMIQEKYHS